MIKKKIMWPPSRAGWTASSSADHWEPDPGGKKLMSSSKLFKLYQFCLNSNIDPVRIKDEDGAEEEDEEWGGGVDKPNCCSSLELYHRIS